MPIVVFTVALFLGVSSPEYQEFRKHSNGNGAYSISFVNPCKTGLRDTNCNQLAQADQGDLSLRRAEPSTRSLSALRRIKPCAS